MASEDRRAGRWARRMGLAAFVLLAAGGVWGLRGVVLRHLAETLVVDQAPGAFTVLWIFDEGVDRRFDLAGELYRTHGCRIAIARPVTTRVVQLGIEPSVEALSRRELVKRHVPADALVVVDGPTGAEASEDQILAGWLGQHPELRVLAVCGRFRSAAHRRRLDAILGPQAGRVAVRGVRDRRYDETDWWRSRLGAKEFFAAWVNGGRERPSAQVEPDRYERQLFEQWRGTP